MKELDDLLSSWNPSEERISSPEYISFSQTAKTLLGYPGKMISSSKSSYSTKTKKNLALFNANVCVEVQGKIWFGDLDLSKEEKTLKELAKILDKKVYVLLEHHARFEYENEPRLQKAVLVITPDGKSSLSDEYSQSYTRLKNGKIVKKEKEV